MNGGHTVKYRAYHITRHRSAAYHLLLYAEYHHRTRGPRHMIGFMTIAYYRRHDVLLQLAHPALTMGQRSECQNSVDFRHTDEAAASNVSRSRAGKKTNCRRTGAVRSALNSGSRRCDSLTRRYYLLWRHH